MRMKTNERMIWEICLQKTVQSIVENESDGLQILMVCFEGHSNPGIIDPRNDMTPLIRPYLREVLKMQEARFRIKHGSIYHYTELLDSLDSRDLSDDGLLADKLIDKITPIIGCRIRNRPSIRGLVGWLNTISFDMETTYFIVVQWENPTVIHSEPDIFIKRLDKVFESILTG